MDRFLNEPTFLEEIDGKAPHVIKLHGVGLFRKSETSEERELWVVEELVVGEDLNKVLELVGKIDIDKLVAIAAFTIRTLVVLHGDNWIHRDIKPANLMISEAGLVKVVDFDVAVKLDSAGTTPAFLGGSPGYMSPEMLDSKEEDFTEFVTNGGVPQHNYKVDIWALGMSLLELALGEQPIGVVAKDDYELVSEYLSNTGQDGADTLLGTVLSDFFAEVPSFVNSWISLVGFDDRYDKDYSMDQLLKDISQKEDIRGLFESQELQNVEFVHFIAECLTLGPEFRPTAATLERHEWFIETGIMAELESLEEQLSKTQQINVRDYPLAAMPIAELHLQYARMR